MQPLIASNEGNLPMMNQKKSAELLETSLIYLLSAVVAAGGFFFVWLISLLVCLGRG